MRAVYGSAGVGLVIVVLLSGCARFGGGDETTASLLAPLFDNLGDYGYAISTDSELAQRYFDQGLNLTYAFNHAEAIRSFEAASKLDPECAMCFWAKALALGPNINAPMAETAVAAAWQAVQAAERFSADARPVEQALIQALSARYAEEPVEDRAELDRAYATAMRQVAADFPDDADVQTLFAEALMDTMPWQYWMPDGEPKPETVEVLAALEFVIAAVPDHPGATHLYIHAVEASASPERAEAAADVLGALMPGAGHLVHMPSHIYLRVGRYHDASVANQRAAAADEAYIASCNAQGFYPALYYPHNIHFLWFSSALEGRSTVSIEAARKVADKVSPDQLKELPELENFLPIPLFSMVRFGRWDEILAEPKPPEELLFLTTMWHYARGLAYVAKEQSEEAHAELVALRVISTSEAAQELEMPERLWPGATLLHIAHDILEGEVAGLDGIVETRIAKLKGAVAMQDALPYMEPPYWYYPVRHSLGVALLEYGRAAEAEAVYRRDLELTPRNGFALFGLEQSLLAQDRTTEAEQVRRGFEEAWKAADVVLTSSRY